MYASCASAPKFGLGGTGSFSDLPLPKVPFYKLPKEVQNTIIAYVSTVLDSSDIITSAQATNALAKVDKILNIKINDPKFTEEIIDNFYTKFLGQKYRLPFNVRYDNLTFCKGTEFSIEDKELGKTAATLLLNTRASIEWLKKNSKIFSQWMRNADKSEFHRNCDLIIRIFVHISRWRNAPPASSDIVKKIRNIVSTYFIFFLLIIVTIN